MNGVTVRRRHLSAGLGLVAVLSLPACCSISHIATESLPDATVGQLYSFVLTHNCSSKGSQEAASWEVVGGGLPPGITLGYDGRLLGTPTAPQSFLFEVLLTAGKRGWGASTYSSGSDRRGYTLTVRP